jgi:hypothetical protein
VPEGNWKCRAPGGATTVFSMGRKNTQSSITTDKLKDVIELHQENLKAAMPQKADAPKLGPTQVKPAELDQDAGGGYNDIRAFPQG